MSETTNQLNPRDTARELKQHLTESLHAIEALRTQVAAELTRIEKGFSKSTQAAKTLRDEVRVEARLAGMEARQRWDAITKQVGDAERRARHELSQAATVALDEAAVRMKDFLRSLHGGQPPGPGAK